MALQRTRESIALPGSTVHLWLAPCLPTLAAAVWSRRRELMDDAEIRAARASRTQRRRVERILGSALVRAVLPRYGTAAALDLSFTTGPAGKPSLVPARDAPPLRFNLAHGGAHLVLAVMLGRDVGCDVEPLDAPVHGLDGAGSAWLCGAERAALATLGAHERPSRLVRLWVVKEAVAKAAGRGIGVASDEIRVTFDREDRPRVAAHVAPGARGWHVAEVRPDRRHVVAIATPRGREPAIGVHVHDAGALLRGGRAGARAA